MAAVRSGDTLVVTELDRFARSLPDARDIADELTRKGVSLSRGASVYGPTDPGGRLECWTKGAGCSGYEYGAHFNSSSSLSPIISLFTPIQTAMPSECGCLKVNGLPPPTWSRSCSTVIGSDSFDGV